MPLFDSATVKLIKVLDKDMSLFSEVSVHPEVLEHFMETF
jgi:hypothetical protein